MKKKLFLILTSVQTISISVFAQPYIDLVNCSFQTFTSDYKNNQHNHNKTDNVFFNIFVPKELKNGNTLILRINSETIQSSIKPTPDSSGRLTAISIPIGCQFVSKNKKLKTTILIVPKTASDFKDPINSKDMQLGGIFILNYLRTENLKLKAGLLYNYEAFGNFIIPLLGVDWKVNKRWNMYGILPASYKIEYSVIKDKFYTGLGFRSFTRSFRLSKADNYDYVRYNEMQVKIFFDCFVYKKLLMFGEVGYSIGKSPQQYRNSTKKDKVNYHQIYSPLNPAMIFNLGMAYRLRMDLQKKEEGVK